MVLRETYRPPQEYVPDIFPERFVSEAQHRVFTLYQQALDRLGVELQGEPPHRDHRLHPGTLQIDHAHRRDVIDSLFSTGLLPHRGEIHSFRRLLTGSQATEQELAPDTHVLSLLAGARVATFLSDYHQILNGSIHRYVGTREIYDLAERLREKHRPYGLYSMSNPNKLTGFGRNLFYRDRKSEGKRYDNYVHVYPVLTESMLRDDIDTLKQDMVVKHPKALSNYRGYRSEARAQTIQFFLHRRLGSLAIESSTLLCMAPNPEQYGCIKRWNPPEAEISRRDPFFLYMFTTAPKVRDHDINWERTTVDEATFWVNLGFVRGLPYLGVREGTGGGALAVGFEVRGRRNYDDIADASVQSSPGSSFYNKANAEQLVQNATRFTSGDMIPSLFFVQSLAAISAP